MEKAAYKTKQQDLLFSYLEKTKGKHFTTEDVYSYFSKKEISIGRIFDQAMQDYKELSEE